MSAPPVAEAPKTPPSPEPAKPPLHLWWLALLGFSLLWDLGGTDLAVMHAIGTPAGFPLRDHWLLSHWLHDALRQLATVMYLLLWVWALWPRRWSHIAPGLWTLPRRERLAVSLLVTLSLLAVSLIKSTSRTSCPWDLEAFGGPARYLSHWTFGQADGGGGRCFPGGHVSSAFGFLALCLPWLAPPSHAIRRRAAGQRWLFAILFIGLVAGAAQTLRGAHYPSHTLWTLVICSAVSLAGWKLMNHPRRAARDPL